MSEGGWSGESHALTCQRMDERQLFSMEIETVGGMAIETVTHDGQALAVGAMHAQLMGPSSVGRQGYAGKGLPFLLYREDGLVGGVCGLAVDRIDKLAWTVERVWAQG